MSTTRQRARSLVDRGSASGTGMPVVAGVDGSPSALDAVRFAAEEAARRGVGLRLVVAFSMPTTLHTSNPALAARFRRVMRGLANEAVRTAVATARAAQPTVMVDAEIRSGSAIRVLLDEARGACLLVLGSRGLGGFTGLLLGSVAVAAAAKADCPVAVVREMPSPSADRSALPVVVGVDTSSGSASAATFAFEAASAQGVPLTVVHAWADELPLPRGSGFAEWADIEQHQRALLTHWLAPWTSRYPEVRTQMVVMPTNPARELIAESARSRLLVVGSRGRGGLAGLLLGSVSKHMLQHAHCPVVVARDRARTTLTPEADDAATTAPARTPAPVVGR